jgi:hypothetical protein
MCEARDTIASLKTLHARMAAGGLVVSLVFPWTTGEVIDFGADRAEGRLGIRDLWWLSSLKEDHRADALALLRLGATVEDLAMAPPPSPPPTPKPIKKRKDRRPHE